MKKIVQVLGRTNLSANSSIPLDLQNLPEGNLYVTDLIFEFNVTVSAEATANEIKAAIGRIYLRTGEHTWVNGLTVNDIAHFAVTSGNLFDAWSGISSGSAGRVLVLPFRIAQLKDPLDTCPNVAQFKPNSTVIFNTGSFANISSISVEVTAVCIDRKNVYVAPYLKLDKQTITTEGSGYIKVGETCVNAWFEFDSASVLDKNGTVYINGEPIIVNRALKYMGEIDQLPYANYGDDPYADSAVNLVMAVNSISLESPLLPANSTITYKDFDASAVPFRFVTIGLVPVRTSGGSPVVASSVAPLKV